MEYSGGAYRLNADIIEVGANIRYIADGKNRITFGPGTQDFIVGGVSKLNISSAGVNIVTNITYYDTPGKEGTWRKRQEGNDLITERFESGAYVEKARLTP